MNSNVPPIAEKVKFWEEQDKINQAIIPRIIEMNESIKRLTSLISDVDSKIPAAESRIKQNIKDEIISSINEIKNDSKIIKEEFQSLTKATKLSISQVENKMEKVESFSFSNKHLFIIYSSFIVALASIIINIIK